MQSKAVVEEKWPLLKATFEMKNELIFKTLQDKLTKLIYRNLSIVWRKNKRWYFFKARGANVKMK